MKSVQNILPIVQETEQWPLLPERNLCGEEKHNQNGGNRSDMNCPMTSPWETVCSFSRGSMTGRCLLLRHPGLGNIPLKTSYIVRSPLGNTVIGGWNWAVVKISSMTDSVSVMS